MGDVCRIMIGDQPAAVERRKSHRMRVLKRGQAVLKVNLSVLNCTIRDLSEGGARLALENTAAVPHEFCLLFVAENEMRDVRVVWRRPDQMGVEFLSPPRHVHHLKA